MKAGDVHFAEENWDRIERDYSAWWAGELERPLIYLTGTAPEATIPEINSFIPNHPPELSAERICELFGQRLHLQRFYGDAFPHWFINFGAGVLAAFLGAKLNAQPLTVWFEPASEREMKDIHPVLDPESRWWRRVVELTQTACDYWDGQVAISHTDLGGTLDVLASLRGTQNLLMDLADTPDEVERAIREVSAAWRWCYDRLTEIIVAKCRGTAPWTVTWSPGRTYMLQCDFCYMISPAMFERFVLSDLATTCDFLDDAFYHLDGVGELPHLDMMLSIKSLKGVQWVPGAGNPPPAAWPDVLRRIRNAGKLCQVNGTPQEALAVIRELGGRGFQFVISGNFSAEEATAFLKEAEREAAEHRRR